MLINEKRNIKKGRFDKIPFIGRWLSKKTKQVEYEDGATYIVDFGENGKIEISFDKELDLPEEKKRELLDQLFRQIKLYGKQGEHSVDFKQYKVNYNKQTKKWITN